MSAAVTNPIEFTSKIKSLVAFSSFRRDPRQFRRKGAMLSLSAFVMGSTTGVCDGDPEISVVEDFSALLIIKKVIMYVLNYPYLYSHVS